MNYLFITVLGLIAALSLITGCARVREVKPVQSSKDPLSMNIAEEQQQKELNAFESEGIALIKKGELDKAFKVYEKIAGLSYYRGRGVRTTAMSVMLGDIHDYGDIGKCVGWCSDHLEKNPDQNNIGVAQDLAVLYSKLNRFSEARGALKPFYSDASVSADFYHDYSKYCIDMAEHGKMEASEKQALMKEAKAAIDTLKGSFGESQKYYVALSDYYVISRDFKSAREAQAKAVEFAKKDGDMVESAVLSTYSNFVQACMSVLNGWDKKEALSFYKKGMEEISRLDQFNYERFYADRPLIMLTAEYFLNDSPVESWQIKKIMDEHAKMEAKGMTQPKHLKVLYQEIYNFTASREKGDTENSLRSIRRLLAYLAVSQECPAYKPVYMPVALSMFCGFRGQAYYQKGDIKNAEKAFGESLRYVPENRYALEGLNKLKNFGKI